MSVKTKAELVTQSDNTFLDNTTGQIVPTNHRLWNGDVLDTMFTIAGISVTTPEFDDLVTNQQLVEGCVYKITDYSLTSLNNTDVFVTAKNSFQVYHQAYCFIYDALNLLRIEEDGTGAKVLFSLGKGINTVGELYEFIDQLVPASFYGNGAEFNFFTSSGTGNYWQFQGRMASTYDDLILNHNIYGSLEELGASRPKSRLKGFLPQDNSNERKYFYPDHGTQTEWGHLAGGAAGNVTQLAIIDSLNFNSISDLYGNWQKVNNIIFGQIQFNANVQPNDIDIFTFNLPHITDAAPSFMANGVANSSTGNHKFVLLADAANGSTASMKIDLIGNHSGDLDIKIGFSFSYSLGY